MDKSEMSRNSLKLLYNSLNFQSLEVFMTILNTLVNVKMHIYPQGSCQPLYQSVQATTAWVA